MPSRVPSVNDFFSVMGPPGQIAGAPSSSSFMSALPPSSFSFAMQYEGDSYSFFT